MAETELTTTQKRIELMRQLEGHTVRTLAFVEMAAALTLPGENLIPEPGENTDRDDRLEALLTATKNELETMYAKVMGREASNLMRRKEPEASHVGATITSPQRISDKCPASRSSSGATGATSTPARRMH